MNWNRYEEMAEQAAKEFPEWASTNKVQTFSEAWKQLDRVDWMLWLADIKKIPFDESKMRLFACDCAEEVLALYQEKYPGDNRPSNAVTVARRFAEGNAGKEALDSARLKSQVALNAAHATAVAALTTSKAADIAELSAEAASKSATQGLMSVMFGDDVENMKVASAAAKAKEAAADTAYKNAKAAFAALKVATAADAAVLAAFSATDSRCLQGAAIAARVAVQMGHGSRQSDKTQTGTPVKFSPADRLREYFPDHFQGEAGNQPVPSVIHAPARPEPVKQIQLTPSPAQETKHMTPSEPSCQTDGKKWWQFWK